MAAVKNPGKHGGHKTPSRVKYEAANPTVSFRVPLQVYEQLQELGSKTGKSVADIFQEALCMQLADANVPYQKGYAEAMEMFQVTYPCHSCRAPLTVTGDAKAAAAQYMMEHGWKHTQCPKSTSG